MQCLKTVFHVHTDYSDDSDASIESIIASARTCGIDCVAVTDHDSIDGAQALAVGAPDWLHVIIGEEISTAQGHLVGLFTEEHIRPGLHVRGTAERIREQGGLVVVPHPFNVMFGCSLQKHVYEIIDLIDIVEVSNAQNLLNRANLASAVFARRHGLPGLVGSDMHHRDYLASCFQWIPPFDDARSFLAAVCDATLIPGRHPLSYFAKTARLILGPALRLSEPAGYGFNCTQHRYQPEGGAVTAG